MHARVRCNCALTFSFRGAVSCCVRLAEGRALWGQMVRCSRDWSRLAFSYFPDQYKKVAAQYMQVGAVQKGGGGVHAGRPAAGRTVQRVRASLYCVCRAVCTRQS